MKGALSKNENLKFAYGFVVVQYLIMYVANDSKCIEKYQILLKSYDPFSTKCLKGSSGWPFLGIYIYPEDIEDGELIC